MDRERIMQVFVGAGLDGTEAGMAADRLMAEFAEAESDVWVEVFKTGAWTDSKGKTASWDTSRLDQAVEAFEALKGTMDVPLRLGGHDGVMPSVGWVVGLKRVGNVLMARFRVVSEVARQAINKRMYKKVSSGFGLNWPIGDRTFPLVLEHVAILGGRLPAVTGLKDIPALFGHSEPDCVVTLTAALDAAEEDHTMDEKQFAALTERVEKLTAENATVKAEHTAEIEKLNASHVAVVAAKDAEIKALRSQSEASEHAARVAEVNTLVDSAVKSGRALPKDRDALVREGMVLRSLADHGKEDSPFTSFSARLTKGAKVVAFEEKAEAGDEAESDGRSDWDKDFDEGAKLVTTGK